MSIITLSSDGQSPSNFQSFFPQGLQFGRNAEISIMGYSGSTKVQDTNDPDAPNITEYVINDTNNTFAIYIGDNAGSNPDNVYYKTFTITIPNGNYANATFRQTIIDEYQEACYLDCFSGMELTMVGLTFQMNIGLYRPPVINNMPSMKNYE